MNKNMIINILIVTNVITILTLILFGYLFVNSKINLKSLDDKSNVVEDTQSPDNNPLMSYKQVSYKGIIKKEKIPQEYELGDYWYILYFESPQLLDTAYGQRYENFIEIVPSTINSLDEYLNKDVTIEGRLSTGYAESLIILVDNIVIE